MSIAVVYLYHAAEPPEHFENFVASYKRHDAGVPHTLVVACKGESDWWVRRLFAAPGVSVLPVQVPSYGTDLFSYRRVVDRTEFDYYCFLNSKSVIEKPDWLVNLYSQFADDPKTGLVGYTWSCESFASRKAWLLPLFPPFPNAHIRTNAFMIRRALAVRIWPRWQLHKWQAYLFESGRRSLSRRVIACGFENCWLYEFRTDEHQHLPVSDRRTREYDSASEAERKRLRKITWGG